MATFLFWNINRKPLSARIARIAAGNAVDVVILAECAVPSEEMIDAFTVLGLEEFSAVTSLAGSLRVFHRTKWVWDNRYDGENWQVFRVRGKPFQKALITVAHLRSKLRANPADQESHAINLVKTIRFWEQRLNIDRTIVVGDFNMNPFERGLTGARELHAVMTRTKAGERTRQFDDEDFPFFYNPMWSLFGDRTHGPAGTYYAGPDGAVSYFWEMFDQVLLRPSLMDGLEDLRILDHDGVESLLTKNGLPDKENGSDHLPILFRLSMK